MFWNKNLTRPLLLANGMRLKTLFDVRSLFLDRFSNIKHSEAMAHAGELLLKAADTGELADIAAATDQTERVLRAMRLTP
jgi:hypothetical protein